MKKLQSILILLAIAANIPTKAQAKTTKPLNVAFLIYPGVEVLDLSGPLDVFVKANDIKPNSYNIYTVGAQSKTVATQSNTLTLTARYTLQNSPRPDIVIIPGAGQKQVEKTGTNPQLRKWLNTNASSSQTVMSVCTGAFILGKAGLLNGRNSTSHWLTVENLQSEFPRTRAYEGVTYIEDGNIVTTAGVSSGIDGALFLIEKQQGKSIADGIAKAIQYRRGAPAYPNPHRTKVVVKQSPKLQPGQKLALSVDPVCGMNINATSTHVAQYQGKFYGFCSSNCQHEFEKQPAKYLKSE